MKAKGMFTLTNDNLRCSAMPLGGIGTGTIAIGGDGLLKQWQITNTVNHRAFVPNSFFAIRTTTLNNSSNKPISRALICTKPHEKENFVPAKSVSDHRITSNMRDYFQKLPQVENIIFDGEYPHSPKGCISQAWSVAETLRAYIEDILYTRPKYEAELLGS